MATGLMVLNRCLTAAVGSYAGAGDQAFPLLNPVFSLWGRRTQGRQEPPLSSEFESSGHVVSDQVTPGGLACSWLVGVGYGLRLSVCYHGVVRLSEAS